MKKPFSLKKRIQSFSHAFNGLKILIAEEHNARIHLVGASIAIVLGLIYPISKIEWYIIILCIAFVITLELINSAIEKLCDVISPDHHPAIKKVKDMSAAAVLIAAMAVAIIGMYVFIPKILY